MMMLVVKPEMVRILVAATLLRCLLHLMGVLVILDLGMRLGRVMRPRHPRHRQQNKQNHYDRAHRMFLRGSTMQRSSARQAGDFERNTRPSAAQFLRAPQNPNLKHQASNKHELPIKKGRNVTTHRI